VLTEIAGNGDGAAAAATISPQLESHCRMVVRELMKGWVVPFLGAGVNLCGRPDELKWERGRYLPSGTELAEYLAESYSYSGADRADLLRVSQYIAVMTGDGPLYRDLREVFDHDYPPTELHHFLATLPGVLRRRGATRFPLVVTTNYDDALECAFRAAEEPFDLVWYVAEGAAKGRFVHRAPEGEPRTIDRANEYGELSPDERTVILKIHGAVDRSDRKRDSYVVTEDDYIDYLTHEDVRNLIPITLVQKLEESHFLFLGYSMRDWNLRVILRRIWGEQTLNWESWAVQRDPKEIERRFWGRHGVEILDVRLEEYVEGLRAALHAFEPDPSR
jgi:SIR2-like domain